MPDLEQEFFESRRARQASPQTLDRLRFALNPFRSFLADRFEVCTADRLRVEHMDAYQRHLTERRTAKGLPLKATTINTRIKSVRTFLDFLHERGFLARRLSSCLVYVREPKLLPTSVLNHAQVRRLLRPIDTTTALGIRDRAALELFYSSGIRIGELQRLTPNDIDLERAVAKVYGKGRKERYVPIGKTALRWLTSYLFAVRPFLLARRRADEEPGKTPPLFLGSSGSLWTFCNIRVRIHKYAKRARLDVVVTPHTFRRSCATEMIKGNANLYHVKELLGHETLEMLQHYAKLDITDLQRTHARCHPREKDA